VTGPEAVDLLQAGGPWAAVVGLVLAGLHAILSGALVPRTTLDVLTAQWEARIAESNKREADWQEAFRTTDARADLSDKQLGELMIYARNTDRLLQNLPGLGKAGS
jgi:hypothetical protein